jgi:hypothetical protein
LKPGNVLPVVSIESEIVASTPEIRKPRRKAYYEPLFQIKRPKENFLCQLESFAEWLKDLDLRFATIHVMI